MANISCMGFNILSCDTHDCGYELPVTRIRHVIQTIKDHPADLIGVQEACNLSCKDAENKRCRGFDWVEPLVSALKEEGYEASLLRDQTDFALEKMTIASGLIIFYKKDRFTLNESGCYCFAHDKNRYFQWVKLTDNEYGRNILFTNTHFSINPKIAGAANGAAGDAYKTVEAAKLLNFWWSNCDENTALFATGDYNSVPDSPAQTLLRSKQFKPSYMIAEIPDQYGTVNFSKTCHIIDYCYVNPTAQAVKQYKVIRDSYKPDQPEYKLSGYASDHRAIMTWCDYKAPVEIPEEV